MPDITAGEVFNSARVYLNDPNTTLWTDARLLPYLKEAYEYGRNEQASKDLPNSYKTDTQTVVAGQTTLATPPSDLLLPIKLAERTPGTTDPFVPMSEAVWDINATPVSVLQSWNWRNQQINFLGALEDREVITYYLGDMNPTGIDVSSSNLLGNIRVFLGAKVAALVLAFSQQDFTKAKVADGIAEEQLEKIISTQLKYRQSIVRRPRPFVAYPATFGRFRS